MDHGWVRVLAAGGPSAPAFVVNGGGLPGEPREVLYLAPDSLRWFQTGLGHSDWLRWLLAGDLDRFYEGSRWAGWQDEVRDLRIDQEIATYPPLCTKQGQDVAAAARSP